LLAQPEHSDKKYHTDIANVAGVPINAFLNIGFLVAFVLPLWRSPKIVNA